MYIYQYAIESLLRDEPFKMLPKRFKEHPSYALCTGAHSRSYLAQCAKNISHISIVLVKRYSNCTTY